MGVLNKQLYIVIIIVIAAIAIAVAYLALNVFGTPVVAVGDNISVYYTGKLTNGTVFDSNVGRQPLQFTVGSGQIITGFDNGVIGMKLNQNKTITIPANQAYGEVNSSLIVQVPLSSFGNQSVKVGMIVTQTSPSGQQFRGMVTAVNSTAATVDFNPPLAGKTLIFNIKVISIKK